MIDINFNLLKIKNGLVKCFSPKVTCSRSRSQEFWFDKRKLYHCSVVMR